MNQRLTLLRLEKEAADLERNHIEQALVRRVGTLHFHFCLYGLQGAYTGGLYHGLLQLHEDYPFRAPKLYFYTPSGRFEINTPICTSFTNYHQESWTSAWNVRTLILATISFMYTEQPSFGARTDSIQIRQSLARRSRLFNLKNPQFVSLFRDVLPPPHPLEFTMESDIHSDQLIHDQAPLIWPQGNNLCRKKVIIFLLCLLIILLIFVA